MIFQWDDVDDARLVLEQHVQLDFYSVSSLKRQSAGRHVAPLRTHYLDSDPSQPSLILHSWQRSNKYPFYCLRFDPTSVRTHDLPHSKLSCYLLLHWCGSKYIFFQVMLFLLFTFVCTSLTAKILFDSFLLIYLVILFFFLLFLSLMFSTTSMGYHGHDHMVPIQSVPITTNIVGSNPAHGEVYSIQHYMIKIVSDLRQVCCFLHFPPQRKLTAII